MSEDQPSTTSDIEAFVAAFDPGRVLFHGNGVLAVDKPAGLPVHASGAGELGLGELLAEWARIHPGVLDIRPGKPVHPAHLLDREASGVVLFGLKTATRKRLQALFAAGDVPRRSIALVSGPVEESGELHGRVRSKLRGRTRMMKASIAYRRIHGDDRLSLVEVEPSRGRTHQLRALFAAAGRPLAGDLRYGRRKPARQFRERFDVDRAMLHVLELELPEEIAGARLALRAPIPGDFERVFERTGWDRGGIAEKLAGT